MDDWQRQALDSNLIALADSLDLIELLPFLQQKGILREYHVDAIRKKTPYEARLEFVSIIKRRGPNAFEALCEGLARSGQTHLEQALRSCKSPNQPVEINNGSGGGGQLMECPEELNSNPQETKLQLVKTSAEQYYFAESILFSDVPMTDGLLSWLKVKNEGTIPADYNTVDCYKHSSKPKGLALIINNCAFTCDLPNRLGSDIDCKNIYRLLTDLGYDVIKKHNLTAKGIVETMVKFSLNKEHERCDSAVVVILTHGLEGEIYGSDGGLVSVQKMIQLLDAVNCPALKNKPKLFFLQACRGQRYDSGHDVIDSGDAIGSANARCKLNSLDENDAAALRRKVPTQADILIAYSTTPGFVSWRNSLRGTWFIQAVCEVFSEYAWKEEVLHLFTRMSTVFSKIKLPPGITFDELIDSAKDWAQIHGLCIRLPGKYENSDEVQLAPFTLLPSPFSKSCFDTAVNLHQAMMAVYHQIAFDYDFMEDALSPVMLSDVFVSKLFGIYRAVMKHGNMMSRLVLNIQRCDYMMQEEPNSSYSLKQVEVNHVAASFAGLGVQCRQWHRLMLSQMVENAKLDLLPENHALETVALGLLSAWRAYGHSEAIILIMVEDELRNFADQRLVEYKIQSLAEFQHVPMRRFRLTHCPGNVAVDRRGRLMLNGVEVAVVYYRTGYLPKHFPNEDVWSAFLQIELSEAIKCPWIGFHLAGMKRMQLLLSNSDTLRSVIDKTKLLVWPVNMKRKILDDDDDEMYRQMKSVTVPMHDLDPSKAGADELMKHVDANADNFVLKPHLEGGGNNFYGQNLIKQLNQLCSNERSAYVLMERIRPPTFDNWIIRANIPAQQTSVVSELGTFGYSLATGQQIISCSRDGGFLLRTKPSKEDEGGVMVGAAALDTPHLLLP
ncbi:Glutathione synthetase [Trichinella sp. T9]|nr:Glutathione synthetase [Trichinella sp. T9]